MANLLYGVFAILFIAIFVLCFLAYFVSSFDSATGVWRDGLGRELEDAPSIARLFFGANRKWPGWGWFVVDLVIFWGGIVTAFHVGGLAKRFDRQ